MTFLSPEDPEVREQRRRNMIEAYNRQTRELWHDDLDRFEMELLRRSHRPPPPFCIPCAVLAVSLSVAIGMAIAFVLPAFF